MLLNLLQEGLLVLIKLVQELLELLVILWGKGLVASDTCSFSAFTIMSL